MRAWWPWATWFWSPMSLNGIKIDSNLWTIFFKYSSRYFVNSYILIKHLENSDVAGEAITGTAGVWCKREHWALGRWSVTHPDILLRPSSSLLPLIRESVQFSFINLNKNIWKYYASNNYLLMLFALKKISYFEEKSLKLYQCKWVKSSNTLCLSQRKFFKPHVSELMYHTHVREA